MFHRTVIFSTKTRLHPILHLILRSMYLSRPRFLRQTSFLAQPIFNLRLRPAIRNALAWYVSSGATQSSVSCPRRLCHVDRRRRPALPAELHLLFTWNRWSYEILYIILSSLVVPYIYIYWLFAFCKRIFCVFHTYMLFQNSRIC